jgi:hypothetical protein
VLGPRGDHLDVGQPCAHLLQRLDGDDVESRGDERGGQLARAGAQVGHAIAGVELELARGDRDGLGRVPGTPTVVGVGHAGELLCERMQHAQEDKRGPNHRR